MTKRFFIALVLIMLLNPESKGQKYLKEFQSISEITTANQKVFFKADDGVNGLELWITDGTPEGTNLVKDINNEQYGSSNPTYLTEFNGEVYFSASTAQYGVELWKSDGTPSGTVMLKDINTNNGSYRDSGFPRELTVFNGSLYFPATEDGYNYDLYESDGTTENTKKRFSLGSSGLKDIEAAGDVLYFTSGGSNLKAIDGLTDQDFHIYPNDNNYSMGEFTAVNNELFFITYSSYYQNIKLYILSSPNEDPKLLKEFEAPRYGSQEVDNFCAVGNTLFFSLRIDYDDQDPTDALWISNGTSEGTKEIKSFTWDRHLSGSEMSNFISFKGELYLKSGKTTNYTLWKSNGTETGTTFVNDVVLTAPYNEENPPVISNESLFFAGNSELWISDGTTTGTKLYADIHQNGNSIPRSLSDSEGTLYFAADDGSGLALWNTTSAPEIVVHQSSFSSSIPTGGSLKFNALLRNDCTNKSIEISNIGNKELVIDKVQVIGKDFFVKGDLPEIILPQEKVSFELIFAPFSVGKKTGRLSIFSNDENESSYIINLRGTALENENSGFCETYSKGGGVKC